MSPSTFMIIKRKRSLGASDDDDGSAFEWRIKRPKGKYRLPIYIVCRERSSKKPGEKKSIKPGDKLKKLPLDWAVYKFLLFYIALAEINVTAFYTTIN